MGGRGTFASGNAVEYSFKTVDKIEGVKVLVGINGKHGLPEEAHSSEAYISLDKEGNFHEMRIYDQDHYLIKEIAYHPEPNLSGNRSEKVLHIHEYPEHDNFHNRVPRLLTKEEIKMYRKYLKGVRL